jgi:hypothetical protein
LPNPGRRPDGPNGPSMALAGRFVTVDSGHPGPGRRTIGAGERATRPAAARPEATR